MDGLITEPGVSATTTGATGSVERDAAMLSVVEGNEVGTFRATAGPKGNASGVAGRGSEGGSATGIWSKLENCKFIDTNVLSIAPRDDAALPGRASRFPDAAMRLISKSSRPIQ